MSTGLVAPFVDDGSAEDVDDEPQRPGGVLGEHGVVRTTHDSEGVVIRHRGKRPFRRRARIERERGGREELVAESDVLGEGEVERHGRTGRRRGVIPLGRLIELTHNPESLLPKRSVELGHPVDVPAKPLQVRLFDRWIPLDAK